MVIPPTRASRHLSIDMRIGIHSGSVWAGIVGIAKLQFDIWGKLILITVPVRLIILISETRRTEVTKFIGNMP